MTTGGLKLRPATPEERAAAGVRNARQMALWVENVGQYGPHAAAKKAGFQKEDIIVAFDGQTDLLSETDLLAYGVTNRRAGERVPVTVLRKGQRRQLQLPMQP